MFEQLDLDILSPHDLEYDTRSAYLSGPPYKPDSGWETIAAYWSNQILDYIDEDLYQFDGIERIDNYRPPALGLLAGDRRFVIQATIKAACMTGASWPPSSEPVTGTSERIEDYITWSEAEHDGMSHKNARLVGALAALYTTDLKHLGVNIWRMNGQLGMLYALGAAMAGGLPLEGDAIDQAVEYQIHHIPQDDLEFCDDPFTPVESAIVIDRVRHITEQQHIVQSVRGGPENIIEYLTGFLDPLIRNIPPGWQVLDELDKQPDWQPVLTAYQMILVNVLKTRRGVIGEASDIDTFMTELNARWSRQQKELRRSNGSPARRRARRAAIVEALRSGDSFAAKYLPSRDTPDSDAILA